MATAPDIQWSDEVYTIKKLVDLPEKYYPLIVLVVEGYYGQDDIETLATNQMARFQKFIKQKRVLAKDRKGRILSIPANFPIRFQLAKDSTKSTKSHTLQKILESNKLPVVVKFESKTKWRFRVGSVKHSTSNFGPIEITSTYEACFLAGNSIHNGVIDQKVMLVPVHIDAVVRLARGLKSGTREEWEDMKTMYSTAVAGANFDKIEGTRGIMLYPSDVNKNNLSLESSYPIYFTSGESTITNMSTQSFESDSSLFVMKRNTNLVLSIDRDKMMDGMQGRRGNSLTRNHENERRGIGSRQSGYESDTTSKERRSRPVHRMAVGDTISHNVVNVTLPANDGTINQRASRHARFYDGVARVSSNGYPIRRTNSLTAIDGFYNEERRYRRNEAASSTIPRAIRTRSYRNPTLKAADPRLNHSEKDLRFVGYSEDYNNNNNFLYAPPPKAVSFASPAIVRSNSFNQIYFSHDEPPVIVSPPPPLPRNAPVSVIQTQPPPQSFAREATFGMVHNQPGPPPLHVLQTSPHELVHPPSYPSIITNTANVQRLQELPSPVSYPPVMVHSAPALPQIHHTEQYHMDAYHQQNAIPTYYTMSSTSQPELARQAYYSMDSPRQPIHDYSQQSVENIYSTIPVHEDEGHMTLPHADLKSASTAYIRRPGLERGSKVAFATSSSNPKMIGSKVVRAHSFNAYDNNRRLQSAVHAPPQLIRPGAFQNGYMTSDVVDGPSSDFTNGRTVQTQFIPSPQYLPPVHNNNTGGVKLVTNSGETSVRVMNAASNENVVYQGTLKFTPSVDGDDEVESYVERMEVCEDPLTETAYATTTTSTVGETTTVTTNGVSEHHDWPEMERRKLRDIPTSYTRYDVPIEYDAGIMSAKWRTGRAVGSSLDSRAKKVKNHHGGYREEIRHNGYNTTPGYCSKNRYDSNGMTTLFPTPGSAIGTDIDMDDNGSGIYAVVNKQEQSKVQAVEVRVEAQIENDNKDEGSKDALVEGMRSKEDETSSTTSTSSMTTESSHNQRKDESSYSPNANFTPNKITHEVLVHDNTEYKQYTYNYSAQAGDYTSGEPPRGGHERYEKRSSGVSVGSDNHRVFVRKNENIEDIVHKEGESTLQRAPSMNSLRDVIQRRGTPNGSLRQKMTVAPTSADQVFSELLNTGETTTNGTNTTTRTYHAETRTTGKTEGFGSTHHMTTSAREQHTAIENGDDVADEEPILARVRNSILELDAYLKEQGGDSQTQSEHSSKMFDQFGKMALNNEITTL